jgi:glutamate/tyrosine decarboxylase-like PLP-dependent enzyme
MQKKHAVHAFVQDRDNYAELGRKAADMIEDYFADVRDGTLDRPVPDDQRERLMTLPLPEEGLDADKIFAFLKNDIMPWPLATGHARSYAWINTGPAPIGVAADHIATAMNTGVEGYDHSSVFLNISVGRWLMKLTGFPSEGSFSILFSGGSAASLNALTAARHYAAKQDGWNMREEGLQSGHPPFVIYASAEAHSSIQKCAEQLGIGRAYMRKLPSDDNFRMDVEILAAAIRADRDHGLRPMAVAAAAGSTNVGAIDPLDAIADVCEREDLWLHVDGAYGGFGGLDPTYAQSYKGMERADTLTVDPHKWLQAPLDCGALLMRHPDRHYDAYSLTPDYLVAPGENTARWAYEYMFQLTYGNRALKTWATIARLGRKGMAELVKRCNRLARLLGDMLEEAPDFELLAPVSLSVVNFRFVPVGDLSDEELDALNKNISDRMTRTGEVHTEATKVRGRVSLRACVLHYENSDEDMTHLLNLARRCGEDALR